MGGVWRRRRGGRRTARACPRRSDPPRATPTPPVPSDLRLVPVELSEEPAAAAHVLWEIEGPGGQVLRVYRDSDEALFRYALGVLGGRR